MALDGAPEAHGGAVWGVALLPNGSGFVSASADKSVKFWEWRLVDVEDEDDDAPAGSARRGENSPWRTSRRFR